jgi:hypothetical protein
MSNPCVHGFRTDQCASCRTCVHGFVSSRCGRCNASRPARSTRVAPPAQAPDSVEYAGFEIFYAPEVSGWRFRAPDAAPSVLSYRSAFLARKAIDAVQGSKAAG